MKPADPAALAEAVATVREISPIADRELFPDTDALAIYYDACELLARHVAEHAGELVRVRKDVRRCVEDLAALIPDPVNPDADDWPCQNPADRECLQSAFVRLHELDSDLAAALEPLLPEART